MDKYKNKYRIASARLQNWDYGSNATYFITICTASREHYFGKIVKNKMQLFEIGWIAKNEWLKTPEIRPDMNLLLDKFIVMPNHFHGIIIIGENEYNMKRDTKRDTKRRDAMHCVSTIATIATTTTTATNNDTKNEFGPQSKNLASIIRGFKSSVTTFAHKNNIKFGWQSRYHDHIIRNDAEYNRIKTYIIENPANWPQDKFYQ
ncbi:MAG: hypothetical protein KAV70_06210 [Bacteroidales bacterium]|nr:hypothetical protein [Bacteroidales bacterium]